MELTVIQKALIFKLMEIQLKEIDQEGILIFLKEENQQREMLVFLLANPNASNQQIMEKYTSLIAPKKFKI